MVLRADRTTARLLGLLRFVLLAFVALLVAHDTIHLVQHQFDGLFGAEPAEMAMQHGGHWPLMSMAGTLAGVLLLVWTVISYGRLRGVIHRRAFAWRARPPSGYRPEVARLWRLLYPAVVVAYALLENMEHFAASGRVEGIFALMGGQHAVALPVLAVVTLGLAAIGAVVRWRLAVLRARLAVAGGIRLARRMRGERPQALWWVVAAVCAHVWIAAGGDQRRAPPAVFAAP